MKKIFILIFLLIMTGCKNTMKCTSSIESDSVKIDKNYKIIHEDNNILTISEKTVYILNDELMKQNFDTLMNFTKNEFETNNIKYDYKNKENKYIINAFYDISNMSQEAINYYFETIEFKKYIEFLKEQGFVCK